MTRIKYMPNHWGMHEFNRDPSLRNVSVTVNVGQLEEMAAGADSIDPDELASTRLLGSGRVTTALSVTVERLGQGR
ncbi:MAG: hypothetical protein CM15mP79_2020 [Methanobacteriota archaeon]|nr:MAG: hypothetical protein CM15mP79_2020 [Euryarchaeota archaeon]